MKNLYDEDYYERGVETGKSCYTNYRWIPELTIPLAARMIEYLSIKESDEILDFGCAKGYLVKAFRLLHRNGYGYDPSKYAIESAADDIKQFLSTDFFCRGGIYDWIIAKDVFEHIDYEDIGSVLNSIKKSTRNLFAIIPLGKENKYVVPAYELDKTHIIREDLQWWSDTFVKVGFSIDEASYNVKYIKENYASYKFGNGFFVLHVEDNI